MANQEQLKSALLAAATTIESQLDAELEELDNMDYDKIRAERLKAMKKEREQKIEWRNNGHGMYTRLPEEKCFFDAIKSSEKVVCHFYQDNSERCKIVDMHLKRIAEQHIETRFVALPAPKCPFLAEKLKIKVLPTILTIVKQKTVDRIIGFTDLGNRDDFSTKMLEWRLAISTVIDYDGDLTKSPDEQPKKINRIPKNRNLRDEDSDGSDDEY